MVSKFGIIPISKLLGNYNWKSYRSTFKSIIPISKLLGNYNILYLPKIRDKLYQYLNC